MFEGFLGLPIYGVGRRPRSFFLEIAGVMGAALPQEKYQPRFQVICYFRGYRGYIGIMEKNMEVKMIGLHRV